MKLLLDTSVVIRHLRDDPTILDRLLFFKQREVSISSIVLMEVMATLHHGDGRVTNRAQVRAAAAKFPVVDFDSKAAACAAALFAKHDIRGDRAPVFDGLIAAHAQSLGVPIAYVDGDFNRFKIKKQLWLRA